MMENLGFADVTKIYGKKLLIERCLVILTKWQSRQSISYEDRGILDRLISLISNVSQVDSAMEASSLTSDDVESARMIARAVTGAALAGTRSRLMEYVGELVAIVSDMQSGKVVAAAKLKFLTFFLEAIASEISEQLELSAKRKGIFALPLWSM